MSQIDYLKQQKEALIGMGLAQDTDNVRYVQHLIDKMEHKKHLIKPYEDKVQLKEMVTYLQKQRSHPNQGQSGDII